MADKPTTVLSREYQAGAVLFAENDPGSRMYVIRSGRVKIFKKLGETEVVLAFLGTGDFFGEMALLEGLPRSASAMVVEPSTLVEVDADTFGEMIRRNIEIAVRIMRKLAGRVRNLDERVEKLMVDNALGRALEVLRWLIPQGHLEEDWIRVRGAAAHLDIAAQAGIPQSQARSVESALISANCLRFDGEDLLIGAHDRLDHFAGFLDLKRQYEPMLTDDPQHPAQPSPHQAIDRLLKALKLTGEDVDKHQTKMAAQYQRYLDLKQHFADIED